MPVPLRKTARSSRAAIVLAATAAAFRLRLGGGVALCLRSSRLSACAALLPLADRRPKPVSLFFYEPSGAVRHSAPTISVCGQATEPTSQPPMLRARASSERAVAERNASRTIERRGQCCPNVQERRRILRKTDG